MVIRASKICFSNPKENGFFIKCHNFFPSNHQRKLLGELLFLIQLKVSDSSNKKIMNLVEEITDIIINGLRTNYYNPEALKNLENIEEHFENSLQKLNRLIYQEIIGSRSFESIIKKLDAVIGLSHDEKVYFSTIGSTQVFILKKNKIIDLVSEETPFNPSRIFSQIISGNLEKNDSLFFATPNFLDYFVFEKLSQIVQKNDAENASQKLEELLKNLKNKISVGAILIKTEKKEIKEVIEKEKIITPIKSLEPETPETEKPKKVLEEEPVIVAKKEKIKITIEPEPEKETTAEILVKKEDELETKKEQLVLKKETEGQFPRKKLKMPNISFAFLKKIRIPCLNKQTHLSKIILPHSKVTLPEVKSIQKSPGFKSVIIALILILLSGFSIYGMIDGKLKEKQLTDFFLSLQETKTRLALLHASVSYGDQKRTDALIEEITNKINMVAPKTANQKELLDNTRKEFEQLIDRIYEIKKTDEPEVLADFSSFPRKDGLRNLIRTKDGNFLVFNSLNNEIRKFNLANNVISFLTKTDLTFNRVINYTDKEVLLVANNEISVFNLENQKISPLKIETGVRDLSIDDLEIFTNRLYLLDNQANQIFRYSKTADGFAGETTWFQEPVNLKNAISLTIDGSIYVLDQSGQLAKFYLGKKQPFELEEIRPILSEPTKVYTDETIENIYLLEPRGKRIIIFDKDGKLKTQIFSDAFNNLKDFIVDEKIGKLYLLNDGKIFIIDLFDIQE